MMIHLEMKNESKLWTGVTLLQTFRTKLNMLSVWPQSFIKVVNLAKLVNFLHVLLYFTHFVYYILLYIIEMTQLISLSMTELSQMHTNSCGFYWLN